MTEQTFVRELERRADHVHGAPLSLDDVRGKARSIQRRRRSTALATVSAAVAAAVVLPLALSGSPERSTPDPAPTPPATSTPGVSVLHDGVLTRPDGSTVPLDVDPDNVVQLGVLTDGRTVVATQEPYAVQVYSAGGVLDTSYDVAVNLVTMSGDDRLAAWVTEDSRVAVLETGVPEPTVLGRIPKFYGSPGTIDAVLGSDCVSGGCTVLVGDGSTTRTEVSPEGSQKLRTSEPLLVQDVIPDGDRWAVSFRPGETEMFGCSGIYDPDAGTVLARSCDTTVWDWSPDGAHVIGARGDNQQWGSVEVLDADLDQVLSYEPGDGQVIKDWGWADAEHLLVVVVGLKGNNPDWSLLRVPIDGSEPEVVQGPMPGPNAESAPIFLISD
jgi:hypothetical protein